jgi:hypothetical protein
MTEQQLGGDPEQPRPHGRAGRVVARPPLQRDEEGLGDEVVGVRVADAPGEIAVQRAGMLVEQPPEDGCGLWP